MTSKAPTEYWQLYIDESGDFGDSGDYWRSDEISVVTGLMIRSDDARARPDLWSSGLKGRILDALPFPHFPAHANVLNLPVAWLCAFRIHALVYSEAHPMGEIFCDAVDRIGSSSDAYMTEFLGYLQRGGWPKWELIRAANLWLEHNETGLYQLLVQYTEKWQHNFHSLLTELLRLFDRSDCYVLAGAGRCYFHEDSIESGAATGDPYLDLLERLFERLFCMLRSADGKKRSIRVLVAQRDIFARRIHLTVEHIEAVIGRAVQFPLYPPMPDGGGVDPQVTVEVLEPQAMRAMAHPGLVLADFCSNRLYGLLKYADSWSQLVKDGQERFAVPLQAVARGLLQAGDLPGLATGGRPRNAVWAAFAGGEKENLDGVRPRWMADQAALWIEAAEAFKPSTGWECR